MRTARLVVGDKPRVEVGTAGLLILVLSAAIGGRAAGAMDGGAQAASAEDLVIWARVELASLGDSSSRPASQLARIREWLERAIALAPRGYPARALLAETYLQGGNAAEASRQYEIACGLARGAAEVFPCSLGLAEAKAQDGQFEEAAREYARHLDIGDPRVVPIARLRRAELMMALGRLTEAEADLARVIAGPSREVAGGSSPVARALYGQAVAIDRSGRHREARRVMWRALALDPAMRVLDAKPGLAERPLLPDGEVEYYRGLALCVLGETRAAMRAFQTFLGSKAAGRWRRQAEDHLLALAAEGGDAPEHGPREGRVVAAATVESRGPLPAPVVDAAWRARPGLLEACTVELPSDSPRVVRVPMVIEIDERGVPRRVRVQLGGDADFGLPNGWRPFIACVEKRVLAGLRTVRPAKRRRTSARLELVLVSQLPRPPD